MRTSLRFSVSCALALLAMGCRGATAEDVIERESTLAAKTDVGTLYWDVESSGKADLVIKDSAGQIVKSGVTGQVAYEPLGGVDPEVALEAKGDTGVWHADGPDLDDELTLLRYSLIVKGRPLTGSLHVPKAGTKGLVENAKLNVVAYVKGEHGGAIQVVGEQRFEVVADADSSQTRVYLVGEAKVRPKHVRLAIDADRPELVELTWDAQGYYVAEISVERPRAVTLVVVDVDDDVHVALIGHRPGVVVVANAPPVFWVHRGWGPPGRARGHYKGTPWGPPGHGGVKFRGHDGHEGRGHGDDGHGGKVKVHVKVK
jgi:hypothetical protein